MGFERAILRLFLPAFTFASPSYFHMEINNGVIRPGCASQSTASGHLKINSLLFITYTHTHLVEKTMSGVIPRTLKFQYGNSNPSFEPSVGPEKGRL
jgi:hypothetical protein